MNCLCNVASERKVLLTLGAKKKGTPTEAITFSSSSSDQKTINGPTFWNDKSTHISRGDRILVTNHGNLFPTAVVKKNQLKGKHSTNQMGYITDSNKC